MIRKKKKEGDNQPLETVDELIARIGAEKKADAQARKAAEQRPR